MFKYKIELLGRPIPKQTHRDGPKILSYDLRIGRYCHRRIKYNPQAKQMEEIRELIRKQYPYELLNEPLKVEYLFEFQIPKSWKVSQKKEALEGKLQHWQKPDVTNLVKFYEDCLTNIVYVDDCIISYSPPLKCWSKEAKTTIWIRPFTQEELINRLRDLLC